MWKFLLWTQNKWIKTQAHCFLLNKKLLLTDPTFVISPLTLVNFERKPSSECVHINIFRNSRILGEYVKKLGRLASDIAWSGNSATLSNKKIVLKVEPSCLMQWCRLSSLTFDPYLPLPVFFWPFFCLGIFYFRKKKINTIFQSWDIYQTKMNFWKKRKLSLHGNLYLA